MLRLRAIATALILTTLTAPTAFADHERFIVGTMLDVDPSSDVITSTSGTCVPTHTRDTLKCYFTNFGLWKLKTEDRARKDFEEAVKDVDKDPGKYFRDFRASVCDDLKKMQPDAVRLKYNANYQAMIATSKAFCERPSRDSLLSLIRTMNDTDVKTCKCVVSDWRATFARQTDRWVANIGPSGACGVITVFTLVPHDPKKMKDPAGPVLWTLTEKTVTTHRPDDPLCANPTKNPLLPTIREGATTVSWNAPPKTLECWEIEFTSALEGMSDPSGAKGK